MEVIARQLKTSDNGTNGKRTAACDTLFTLCVGDGTLCANCA